MGMLRLLGLLIVLCFPVNVLADVNCVVLLHGLSRTSISMNRIEAGLEHAGFTVVNLNYPSRDYPLEQLAMDAVGRGIEACEEYSPTRIHFVAHSLGGILVRYYFLNEQHPKLGRVVMLGPPNHGSEVVDTLRGIPGFALLNGPSGGQLGTGNGSMPRFLGAVGFELGVIAGNQFVNPLFAIIVPGPNDGAVSVASTRVEGMRQHLILPVTHSFMMYNPEVIEQAINFLKTGSFVRDMN
ncbi:MAG: alpha/beta hydrolase [Gammaproteobacteria bacterium]|nr:alpha/beta hydrolase [Gammaproteobacteria bacterium]